jgi:hypothetical protein
MTKFAIMMFAGQIALVLAAAFAPHSTSMSRSNPPGWGSMTSKQGSLAVVSDVMGLVMAWLTKNWRWTFGAALILANWSYTLLGMMPTNDRLKDITENDAGPTSRRMIETWVRLHAVRTALGIAATLAYLWAPN